ncbi:putative ribonuclease H-like domain-containing protein [Tanacetum coccineum]
MVPRVVLMKTGLKAVNTARPVTTAHPKTTVYSARPMSRFSKSAQSTVKRPYQTRIALTNKNFSKKVNTAKGKFYTAKQKAINTARPNSTVVNAVKENQVNDVKASACWVWRPTKLNRSSTKKDQGYVDSGCSRHMTRNMSYLSDFKEFNGGYVTFGGGAKGEKITGKGTLKTGKLDFKDVYFVKELQFNLFSVLQMCDKKNNVLFTETGCFVLSPDFKLADESQVLLKVPRNNNMYSVDMKNIVPKESLTCLVAKATLDELMLWHRRLGHVNFKTINKLVKENLVRGLPIKRFENDQTCVACLKGKQHKASCKSKIQNSITQPLFMLHMDLFGPTFVSSLMNKKYCLVVTDDYSRFTWVFFLASKDETSGILKSFITEIENLVDKKVKIIRCDNGTEFKNRVMSEFCEKKGIKREFSVARTPQQNGVAKRRNRTLTEAARTIGRTPALSFMRPFGCHVTVLNTLYYLGKFDGKSDEGFFVGYSLNSKAFRVYNIRTRKVEESLHIKFLEDKPIIAGDRPKWLFDIDILTKSMNYVPYVTGTNSNNFVGTKESTGAGHSSKETGSSQDYILMPLWKDDSLFDSSSKNVSNDEPQPFSDAGKKDDDGVNKESEIDDQERPENSSQDVNTTGPSINTASINVNNGSLNINTISPTFTTAPLEATHADFFGDETEIDMGNITTTYLVPSTPNTRIHKDHSLDHVISDVQFGVQTRRMITTLNEQGFICVVYEGKTHEDLHTCLFACFLSQEEPKKVIQALKDPSWIEAMQEELLQFKLQQVWTLVDLPHSKRTIGTKWVYKTRKMKEMDVKSAFMYGKIEEEVYACQPPGFEDPEFPGRVYRRGQIDKTLFIKRVKSDILLVQVCVDDIIFRSTKKVLCTEFEKLMHKKFQMSSMGELTFFLGLQVTHKDDGICISQDKYVDEILKKFGFSTVKTASIPMETSKPLMNDENAEDVDVHLYRSMISSLMYLTSSRPDIIYLKGQPKLGLWYPKDSPFDLETYINSDYAGASLDRKSTTGVDVDKYSGFKNQMLDYGYNFMNTKIFIDNENTICIVKNSVFHSKTKHIEIRHHFIRDSNKKKLILMIKIHTDHNVADLLTKAFDATAKAKTINGEVQIQAFVDGKKVIITETSVRRALQLKDVEVLRLLLGTNLVALWPQLSSVLPQTKNSTFPMFLDKQVEGMTKHKEIYVTPSHTKKVFANMKRGGKGFSGRVTPLFQTMMVQAPEELDTEVPQPSGSTKPITDEATNEEYVPKHSNDSLLSGEDRLKLNELMELCTNLSQRVLNLENTKTSQAAEITKLKERVKKLERRNKSRTLRLKRLRKGRKIADLDDDAEQEVEVKKVVSTAEVTTVNATTTTANELTLAQTLIEIKAAKPKGVTTASTTTTTAVTRPKARGVVVQEPTQLNVELEEEEEKLAKQREYTNIAEWDNVQAMIDSDYELAARLQAQEQEELTVKEKSKLFVELMDKRKKYFARLKAEEQRRKPLTNAQKRN